MSLPHRRTRAVALLVGWFVSIASASVGLAQSSGIPAAITGVTRSLVVFVRFADDTQHGSGCRANRGWPLADGVETIPSYARALFASEPTPPFADSTVTEYFFRQSNGRFILVGDVYPKVVVTDHEAAYYRSAEGRGYGYLAAEVIGKIDPDVDFREYDTNPRDGVVDQIFVIIRRDEAGTFTGVAHLAGADRVRGAPREDLVVDGVKVDWASSGSFVYNDRPGHIISQSYLVRIIAHEFGHHIWNPRGAFANHIPAITTNDVPENDTNTIGYTLMAGRGGGRDGRGDLLISAPERDVVGWLVPLVLHPQSDSIRVVELHDFFESGEAVRVDIPGAGRVDEVSFYLVNRQRRGWFDRYRLDAPLGCEAYEMGLLRTTGLLIMLTEWQGSRFRIDVLPADNTLELAASNSPYQGDLFGPGGASQITPFTKPSTALPNGAPSWVAFDEIRMSGSADSAMTFTYVPDFRRRAIVREDSWLDDSFGHVVIAGELSIRNGSQLSIEPNAHLEVGGRVTIEPGSSLLTRAGSRLTLGRTSRFFFVDILIVADLGVDGR